MTTVYFHMRKALESMQTQSKHSVSIQDGVPVRASKVLSEKAAQMLVLGLGEAKIPRFHN